MTDITSGRFKKVDPLTVKSILSTIEGLQYEIVVNDETVSLREADKELGRIVGDKSGRSGCIWMEKNGVINEPIGEYECMDGNFRVLGYENFAVRGSWQENVHPLDYLLQRILEQKDKQP